MFALEARVAENNQDTGLSLGWTRIGDVWGALESVALHGSVFNKDKANGTTHCVTVRHRDDIDFISGQSLVSGARRFIVRGIEIIGDTEKWARLWVEEA